MIRIYDENINLKAGEDFQRKMTAYRGKVPLNLTGYSIQSTISRKIPTYQKILNFSVEILDQSENPGGFIISAERAFTGLVKPREVYYMDVSFISPDGNVQFSQNIDVIVHRSPTFIAPEPYEDGEEENEGD